MHDAPLERVFPNVRTNASIIIELHTPDSSCITLHRFSAVFVLTGVQVRRFRTPT